MIKFTQSSLFLLQKAWFLLFYRCSQQRWHTGDSDVQINLSPRQHSDLLVGV
jgi:hypothetical protein